jgi:hypothetical protein
MSGATIHDVQPWRAFSMVFGFSVFVVCSSLSLRRSFVIIRLGVVLV